MSRRVDLTSLVEYARGSLWVLPSASVCLAVVLGVVLSGVDVADDGTLSDLLFPGGVEGARGILEAIASSVITVTSLIFSLTVVTLQLASSQFSPRLLRTFLRRPGNQIVMSVFLATFVYSLVVLRTVRQDQGEEFVPALAVTVAFLLVLSSVAALVYFIHHITSEIRADTLMQRVEEDTLAALDNVHPEPLEMDAPVPAVPGLPRHAVPIPCQQAGIVQVVAAPALLEVAIDHHVVVVLAVRVGERVVKDGILAWTWGAGAQQTPDLMRLTRDVNRTVTVGHERTMQQDVSYGLRQLVDMAAKALSTGVNDPTTAIDATGHLASIMSTIARRRVVDTQMTDDDGTVHVHVQRLNFDDYLDIVCGPIRRYGSSDPDVSIALLHLLREVGGAAVRPAQADSVRAQLDLALEAARAQIEQEVDFDRVRAVGEHTRDLLAGGRFVGRDPGLGS